MKRSLLVVLLLTLTVPLFAADVTGQWALNFVERDGTHTIGACTFTQQGRTLGGVCGPDNADGFPVTGTIDGNELSWRIEIAGPQGTVIPVAFRATLDEPGKFMKGTFTLNGEGIFTAIKTQ